MDYSFEHHTYRITMVAIDRMMNGLMQLSLARAVKATIIQTLALNYQSFTSLPQQCTLADLIDVIWR